MQSFVYHAQLEPGDEGGIVVTFPMFPRRSRKAMMKLMREPWPKSPLRLRFFPIPSAACLCLNRNIAAAICFRSTSDLRTPPSRPSRCVASARYHQERTRAADRQG